ncbi:hypothetical protein HPP92_001790 [Vanilla planifolia]|uniref:Uncharacterized protein n=1 Tax=Vanilla planifolia TaxID=51239 RepID=A0A835S361_VANPL|nr:hypothetical protein HPP92_001790 [Vanilla planifolia]
MQHYSVNSSTLVISNSFSFRFQVFGVVNHEQLFQMSNCQFWISEVGRQSILVLASLSYAVPLMTRRTSVKVANRVADARDPSVFVDKNHPYLVLDVYKLGFLQNKSLGLWRLDIENLHSFANLMGIFSQSSAHTEGLRVCLACDKQQPAFSLLVQKVPAQRQLPLLRLFPRIPSY